MSKKPKVVNLTTKEFKKIFDRFEFRYIALLTFLEDTNQLARFSKWMDGGGRLRVEAEIREKISEVKQ